MSGIGNDLVIARREVDRASYEFMPERLRIVGRGDETKDDFGEVTTSDTTLVVDGDEAQNIPCKYKALTAYEKSVGGSVAQAATHKLRMPFNRFTALIEGGHILIIDPRGLQGELVFEVIGRLDSSTDLMLWVAATLRS